MRTIFILIMYSNNSGLKGRGFSPGVAEYCSATGLKLPNQKQVDLAGI